MVADLLSPGAVARRGLLDPAEVERQRQAFARGDTDYAYAIFTCLTLELWCQAFVDRPRAAASAPPSLARAACPAPMTRPLPGVSSCHRRPPRPEQPRCH